MKFQKKSVSKIALTDLLRRKRTNLGKYISENGIFSYELLVSRCFSVGVIPPTEEQFSKAGGSVGMHAVSSPTEGIVVLNPAFEPVFEDEHVVLASYRNESVETEVNDHLEETDKKEENIIDLLPAAEKKQKKRRSNFSHQNEESND